MDFNDSDNLEKNQNSKWAQSATLIEPAVLSSKYQSITNKKVKIFFPAA